MPSIDMPLEQLRTYKPALYREPDFEAFWDRTISAAVSQPLNAELIPVDLPMRHTQCYAVRYDGFEGGRLAGWYLRPKAAGPFPGVCFYHGYGGAGHRPLDLLPLASQGMCVLSMDCRGQMGNSQDASTPPGGHHAGWMTQGITDPAGYYYRYAYADAVRAIELLAHREEVDPSRLAITGGSQGGGLTLAVAALSERPILALADVPFLCDFKRAISITAAAPYSEIPHFLRHHPHLNDTVIRTLSYFDCMNLAPWIGCRTVIANCLWDDVCPPSTIFAAFNHLACEKQIELYPFNGHAPPYEQAELRFRLISEVLMKNAER